MGRKKSEPLERIAEVEVVSVHREPLWLIDDDDVVREGFGDEFDVSGFIEFFCEHMNCEPDTEVTRTTFAVPLVGGRLGGGSG